MRCQTNDFFLFFMIPSGLNYIFLKYYPNDLFYTFLKKIIL